MESCTAREQLRRSVSNLSSLRRELEQSVKPSEARERHIDAIKQLENRVLEHFISRSELIAKTSQLTIAVVGDFSSGKSTFINALLGQDLCPTDVSPTTSAITYFTHGPRLCIEREQEGGSRTEIEQSEYIEMARHNGDSPQGPFTFHITTPQSQLSFLRLIDTPGFSNPSNEYDTGITQDAASEADALIVVMDIHKGNLSGPLLEQLDRLREVSEGGDNRTPSFLLINQADKRASHARSKVIISNKRKHADLFREIHLVSSLRLAKGCDHQVSQDIDLVSKACRQAILRRQPFHSSISGEAVQSEANTQYEYNIDGNRKSIGSAVEEDLATREDIFKLLFSLLPERQRLLELRLEDAEAALRRDQRQVLNKLLRYLRSHRSIESAYDEGAAGIFEIFESLNHGIIEKLCDFCDAAFDAAIEVEPETDDSFWGSGETTYQITIEPENAYGCAKNGVTGLIGDLESAVSYVLGTPFPIQGIDREILKVIKRDCRFLEKDVYGEDFSQYELEEEMYENHCNPCEYLRRFAHCTGYEIFHGVFSPRLNKLQAEMATSEVGNQKSASLEKARLTSLVKQVQAIMEEV